MLVTQSPTAKSSPDTLGKEELTDSRGASLFTYTIIDKTVQWIHNMIVFTKTNSVPTWKDTVHLTDTWGL